MAHPFLLSFLSFGPSFGRDAAVLTPPLARIVAAFAVLAVCLAGTRATLEARVTRIEVLSTVPVPAPAGAGPQALRFEKISGKAYGELDPRDPKNALITDLELAPRNAAGRVEYVATFALIKPMDMGRASGVLMYTVVNRGNGAPAAMAEGHVSLVSGWQGDVLANDSNYTIEVPVARNRDGTSITGPFVVRWIGQKGSTAELIIPRGRTSPYPPADLDPSHATLISAAAERPTGEKIGQVQVPSSDWAFANCEQTPFPGVADPSRICLRRGFDSRRLYELQYTVKDPLVLGIGFAATRDVNSFFRYEPQDDFGFRNPLAGRIRWAISEGSSQSGAFLRAFIRLGFNQDELGRIVWDGSNPHIAPRIIDLNRRFALPGGTVYPYELGYEAPPSWEDWADTPRGRGTAGLLDRCRATNTCPKIAETFGSAELWGLRASAMLVGTDAKKDIPLPSNVRRYYFAGVTHGGGRGGFSTSTPPVAGGCELPSNPSPVGPMRAALLQRLVEWVTTGAPMPPSRYPTLADGTLVPDTKAGLAFPVIPGRPSPENLMHPLLDYDLGLQFKYQDQSGVIAHLPAVRRVLPQRVVKVDADGNEVAGLKSPLQMAPLGTYTGWNVMSSGPYKGHACLLTSSNGGFIPFARTRAERLASGDPRPSLEERYHSHEGYVTAVSAAASTLVRDGYLRREDADTMIKDAEESDVLRGEVAAHPQMVPVIDHVHMGVPDVAAGVAWYQRHFDGKTLAEAADRLLFGETRMIFLKNESPVPTAGSVLDRIGFSVADLDEALRTLAADGATIVTPARMTPGSYRGAVVQDPWGARLDVVQDPARIGLHHIALRSPDPARALAWYAGTFGARPSKTRAGAEGIDYGGVWLLVERGEAAPSQGHTIDHIGLRPANLDAVMADLKARNVKVLAEPRSLALATGAVLHIAFVEGVDGIRIELVQRPS